MPAVQYEAGFLFLPQSYASGRCELICRYILKLPTIVLILVCLAAKPLTADVGISLSGLITDPCGAPIARAHVNLLEVQVGSVSDRQGRFRFRGLPPGNYTLVASHIGYSPSLPRQVKIEEGEISNVHIVLQPCVIDLPALDVSTPHSRNRINSERLVISREKWKASGAVSVSDALRDLPGITVLEGNGMQRLSLRGSPARAVKVDLDGIPLNDAGTGEAQLDGIQIEDLAKIVIEFSGYGGKVHFLTAEPPSNSKRGTSTDATLETGSFGLYAGHARLQHITTNLASMVRIHRSHENGDFIYRLDEGQKRKRINNFATSTSSILSIDLIGKPGFSVESGFYYNSNHHGVPGLICTPLTPEANLRNARYSFSMNTEYRHRAAQIEALAFYTGYEGRYKSPAEQLNPETGQYNDRYHEDNRQRGTRYGVDGSVTKSSGSFDSRLSYEFRTDSYKGEDLLRGKVLVGGVGLGDAKRTLHRFELDLSLEHRPSGWQIRYGPGLSQEFLSDSGFDDYSTFSPSFFGTLTTRIDNTSITLHSNWGRSLAAPPFNAVFMVESMFAVGNRQLKPERGENLSAGVHVSSKTFTDGEIRLNVNAFRRVTEDLIVWGINSFGKYYPYNLARVLNDGIENEAIISLFGGLLSLSGSYIYNKPRIDIPGDVNDGNVPPLIPGHRGSAAVSITKWNSVLGIKGRWTGRRYSTASNFDPVSTAGMGLSPYSVYDVFFIHSLNVKSTNIEIETGVNNILDESYRIIERSPMPGRSYRLKLAIGLL